jgi:putative glutamine amidotransferase
MPQHAPLIGVPCRHDNSLTYEKEPLNVQSDAYLSALIAAGGTPFLIPLNLPDAALRQLYDLADGILLSGGGDIHPPLYQQTDHPTLSDVQPDRDEMELKIARWAASDNKPLLAICRGIQVLAIVHDGTLCQDIPSQMPAATLHHYTYLDENEDLILDELRHNVTFQPNCRLAQVFQSTTLPVNSLHHQAVTSVGRPLSITGCSDDGIIEAVEIKDHPFYCGVQWHPEMLVHKQEASRWLFTAFVAAC